MRCANHGGDDKPPVAGCCSCAVRDALLDLAKWCRAQATKTAERAEAVQQDDKDEMRACDAQSWAYNVAADEAERRAKALTP